MSVSSSIIKLTKSEYNLPKLSYREQFEILVPRLMKILDNYLISNNLPTNDLLKLQSWQLDPDSYYYLYTLQNNPDYDRFMAFNYIKPSLRLQDQKKVNNITDSNGQLMLEVIFEYHPVYKTSQYITLKLNKNKEILANTKKFIFSLFAGKSNVHKNKYLNFLDNFIIKSKSKKKLYNQTPKKDSKTWNTRKKQLRVDIDTYTSNDFLPSKLITTRFTEPLAQQYIKPFTGEISKLKEIPRYNYISDNSKFKLYKPKKKLKKNYYSLDDLTKDNYKKKNYYSIGGVGSDFSIFDINQIDQFLKENNLPTFTLIRSLTPQKSSRSWNTSNGPHFYYILLSLYNNRKLFTNIYDMDLIKDEFDRIISHKSKIILNEEILVDTYLYLMGEIFNYGPVTEYEYPEKLREKFVKKYGKLIIQRREMLNNKLPNTLSPTLNTDLSNIGKKRTRTVTYVPPLEDKMSLDYLLNKSKKPRPKNLKTFMFQYPAPTKGLPFFKDL